ncbi:30S ribosomal protein S6e [Candidatus Woesearchaeota archaeon]|nr:30S ribosomal protein S6e [Candidatus Woesearchaeota archaeon]
MVEFKVVLSDPESGKSVQKEVKDTDARSFLNLKIKDKVNGELLGYTGYEFEITGGSDNCGVPMRRDVSGSIRKKILTVEGVGIKKKDPGIRQRKLVRGNTVHEKTAQINLKVTKKGNKPFIEEPKTEAGQEEKKEN